MKNPYVFWGLAIVAFIGGIFIGKAEWFNNLFITTKNPLPPATGDGQPCTTTANKPGVYKNGVCTDTGGMPIDDKATRANNFTATNSDENTTVEATTTADAATNGNGNATRQGFPCTSPVTGEPGVYDKNGACITDSSVTRTQGSNPLAANELYLPLNQACQNYTMSNPYMYLGCQYVFAGIALNNGRRMCKLRRTTCTK